MTPSLRKALLNHAVKTPGTKALAYIVDNREFFGTGICRWEVHQAAGALWAKLLPLHPAVLVTKGVAGTLYAMAVAQFAALAGYPVDLLIVRPSRKTTGVRRLVEGPPPARIKPGARAIFVDDLINRGSTYVEVKRAARIDGYELEFIGVGVLIDFYNASRALRAQAIPVEYVLRRHELGLTRQDAKETFGVNQLWHIFELNKDVGLDVKSWPRLHDGKLYVGTDANEFICFDQATGDRIWKHVSESPQMKGNVCVPAFFGGDVFITSYDGTARRLDAATGEAKWVVKVDRNLHSSPTLSPDGKLVFIGTEFDKYGGSNPAAWGGKGDIVALHAATGRQAWRTPTAGMVPGTAAYGAALGLLAIGSNDFHTYILNPFTGAVLKKLPNKGEVKGKPVWNGRFVITLSTRGWLQVYDAVAGDLVWELSIGVSALHPYPIVIDDLIYGVNGGGMVYCVDMHGTVVWINRLRAPVGWGVVPYADRILALTTEGQLVSMDRLTGVKLTSDRLFAAHGSKVRSFQPLTINHETQTAFVATNNLGLLAFSLP